MVLHILLLCYGLTVTLSTQPCCTTKQKPLQAAQIFKNLFLIKSAKAALIYSTQVEQLLWLTPRTPDLSLV